jgi:hypothetical protein
MQEFLHRTRYGAVVLIGCLALELLPWRAAFAGEPARVGNVRVERTPSRITIVYDLIGEDDEKYAVTVTLKRKSRPGVNYSPKDISGDVGGGVVAGKDRRIVWEFAGEFPRGLAADDVYFSVDAESGSSGISPLVWIGGGVAVAGVAAILLLKKKEGTTQSAAGVPSFPDEPARPK